MPKRADVEVPFWSDPRQRTAALTRTLAVALVSGMLLSPRLWLSTRSFPLVPVWDLPAVPAPLDAIWFGAVVMLLIAIALLPQLRWLVVALLVLAVGLALGDQNRWQPWFYQYLAMFAALALTLRKPDDPQAHETALDTCRLILAATYFWSGVQKMNAAFLGYDWPYMLRPLFGELSPSPLLIASGIAAALAEAGIGVGLLFPAVRRFAVAAAGIMHLALLVLLGPFGHDWNMVVWPWNVAMPVMLVVLFWRTPELPPRPILWPPRSPYARAVLILFGVLPGLHLVGMWDAYLSAALYSGNTIEAYVRGTKEEFRKIPPDVWDKDVQPAGDHWRLDLTDWSIRDLEVPAYPAHRVFRRVSDELATRAGQPVDLTLVIREQPHWLTGVRRETTYRCGR